MVTVLFVHGAGIRENFYEWTLSSIRTGLKNATHDALRVEGCLWGDAVGTKLHAGGLSIPDYAKRGGGGPPSEEDLDIELWQRLYADPLYELRVLALGSTMNVGIASNQRAPGQILDTAVRALDFARLKDLLKKAEFASTIESARDEIIASAPYRELLPVVTNPKNIFFLAVARAIVARAMQTPDDSALEVPVARFNADLRNEVVAAIRARLGPEEAGVADWVVRRLLGTRAAIVGAGLASLGTPLMYWRRGEAMDMASPACADMLYYQSRGQRIRDFIGHRIKEFTAGPLVVIGHSLGGVALVDLLVDWEYREHVQLLITVGSQAPYLYETDALRSLSFGTELPAHFPPWVNIYDLRDFLSFCGKPIFPGRVDDYAVNNRLQFPEAHGGYFNNPETYLIIGKAIEKYVL
ncbi:MAG TPA: hypothetical protein VGZ00_09845 [Candidatus Baltobacteraceae bacterium]|nr:hypothetical protein [Candidatus Baltobacteraceae bacterium]